jgi:hypothetical protein
MGSSHLRSDIREKGGARTASFSTFQGALVGGVTGNVTGDVTGSIFGGNVSATNANVSASVTAGSASSKVILDNAIGVRLVGIDVWDDLKFPVSALSINRATSKPDQISLLGNVMGLGFDNTASESVTFWCQMPHDWRQGTAVEPHVHWMPSGTATGNVYWELEYYIADIATTFSSLATVGATDYNDGTANMHRYCDLGSINMSTITGVSAMVGCRLLRQSGLAIDTYGEDAGLLEVDFHYRRDGFGSDGEASKSY